MNILAGDIGGTKTLLGIFCCKNNQIIKLYQKKYISADWLSFEPMINDFLKNLPHDIKYPTHGCLAVAGPVQNSSSKLTNLDWKLDQDILCKYANLDSLELINDICVLIYGIPFLSTDQVVLVQNSQNNYNSLGKVAFIAAGTGLGISKGFLEEQSIIAIPSEGGHAEFSPRSETEWQLSQWIKLDLNLERLSIERIVSGNGLGHIARWRLNQPDAISHPLRQVSNAWITSKKNIKPDLPSLASDAAKKGDPIMTHALNIWLSAYGSVAGDLALQELCNGGLWIGGGTASKQLEGIRSATFLESMRNKGRFYSYLKELPVMALTDPEAGLFSAACRGHLLAESSERLT